MGEIDISMAMMSMYIISSWGEHLQEAEDGMGDGVGWLGGRWGVTLYCLHFFCRLHQEAWGTAQIFQEGWKVNNIQNGMLKVLI